MSESDYVEFLQIMLPHFQIIWIIAILALRFHLPDTLERLLTGDVSGVPSSH